MTAVPLAWLAPAPRPVTPDLISGLDPTLTQPSGAKFWAGGKKGWEEDLSTSEFRWIFIIQAHKKLLEANAKMAGPAVHLYTSDPRAADRAWAEEFIGSVHPKLYDGTCKKTARFLRNEQATFQNHRPKAEATNGVVCKMSVKPLSPSKLPMGHLDGSRMLPGLWSPRDDTFRVADPANY